MSAPVFGANTISAACASAAMTMLTMKTEKNYHVLGFSTDLVPIDINPQMRLDAVMGTISKVCNNKNIRVKIQISTVFYDTARENEPHEHIMYDEYLMK